MREESLNWSLRSMTDLADSELLQIFFKTKYSKGYTGTNKKCKSIVLSCSIF